MAMYLGSNKVEIGQNASGGSSTAPLICTGEDGYLDKTFGEIRTAFLNGNPVIFNYTQPTGESGASTYIEHLSSVSYTIEADPDYPTAYGDIYFYNRSYTVNIEEEPYTIEALDALYPHVPD